MAVVHTEAAAIFNGQLINEAEDKIQYIKYRPSQPFDGNTPINFTIPGNSSQYISLHESYMFVQCHVEQTDKFGNPILHLILYHHHQHRLLILEEMQQKK